MVLFRMLPVLFLAVALGVAVDHWRARPDINRFDPSAMGRAEASMWRDYYDERWVALGGRMMRVAREQYGFSWWDSARASFHGARAALHFRGRTDDPRCRPALRAYYGVLAKVMPPGFSPGEAARLELQWWSERRLNMPPAGYGGTIARLSGLCHGISTAAAEPASLIRAEAMAYRDARRDGRMTEADWDHVAARLREAWNELRAAIDRG
jgi:hypothetical protein